MSVIQEIRELAAKYPDTIYPKEDVPYCRYTEGDCGSGSGCLIGQGLQRSGMKTIAEDADLTGETGVLSLFTDMNVFNKNDRMWLSNVQIFQDSGKTWATSVRLTDRMFTVGWVYDA